MKIFVAGGTGAIGRPLIVELLGKGHAVVALTRFPEKAQALVEQGIEPALADVFDTNAVYAASLIRRRVEGERPAKPFRHWGEGNMAIAGRTFAVADLKHVRPPGLAARLPWLGIHLHFLIGFANRLPVMLRWAISFVTGRRGVRILPPARTEMTRAAPGRQAVMSPVLG